LNPEPCNIHLSSKLRHLGKGSLHLLFIEVAAGSIFTVDEFVAAADEDPCNGRCATCA
jgi:hypothetical protein